MVCLPSPPPLPPSHPSQAGPCSVLDQRGIPPPFPHIHLLCPTAWLALPHIPLCPTPSLALRLSSNVTSSEKSSLTGYLKLQPCASYPSFLFYFLLICSHSISLILRSVCLSPQITNSLRSLCSFVPCCMFST